MMLLVSQIALLGTLAYQDFKSRAVAWYLPILLFAVALWSAFQNNQVWIFEWLMSLLFLVFQLAAVYLYFAITRKNFRFKFFDQFLGWGDVLFLVAVIPFFSFKRYLLYYSTSLIFALSAHLLWSKLKKKQLLHIPLLGWLGLYFIAVFLVEFYQLSWN